MGSCQGHFTNSCCTKGAALTGSLYVHDFKLVRDLFDIGKTRTSKGCVFFNIFIVLSESKSDTLGKTAVDLTVNGKPVVDHTNVCGNGHGFNCGFSSGSFNGNLCQENPIHVTGKGISLGVFIAIGTGSRPFAVELGFNLVGFHLFIVAETAVIFLGRGNKCLAAIENCLADNHLGAASAGRTGIGAETCVI